MKRRDPEFTDGTHNTPLGAKCHDAHVDEHLFGQVQEALKSDTLFVE